MIAERLVTRQGISLAAITVSVLLHLLLFVPLTNVAISGQAQAPNAATRISLNLMPPEKKIPERVNTELTPPTPAPEPKVQPKPVRVKTKAPVTPELAVAPHIAKQIQRGQSDNAALINEQYLHQLLTYIEGYKYYPRLARRRDIIGDIEVSFELLDNGEISDLKTNGDSPILRNAAEQAITSALPLPTPPKEIRMPLQVSYVMKFALN